MQRFARFPFFVFFIAWLPILSSYETNYQAVFLSNIFRSVVFFAVIVTVILVLLRLFIGDWGRASVSAGYLVYILSPGGRWSIWLTCVLSIVWLGLTLALRFFRRDLSNFVPILNAVYLIWILFPVQRTWQASRHPPAPSLQRLPWAEIRLRPQVSPSDLPDIYYLLVDALGRADVLEALYGLAPEQTVEPFRELGFDVNPHSYSNYSQTALTAAAVLNMRYVQDLLRIPDDSSSDRRPIGRLVADNLTTRALRANGYRIVQLPSGYSLTNLRSTDAKHEIFPALNFFELAFLQDTLLPYVDRVFGGGRSDWCFAHRRKRLDYIFAKLPDAAGTNGPAFVFAHILAPHPPFVFDEKGQPVSSNRLFSYRDGSHWYGREYSLGKRYTYRRSYARQCQYVLKRIHEAVQQIIQARTRPLVIIVQGDHGPGSKLDWNDPQLTDKKERMSIFNAVYVSPEVRQRSATVGQKRENWATRSPVNTFIPILHPYFTNIPTQVPDRAWFVRWSWPYLFEEYVEEVDSTQD